MCYEYESLHAYNWYRYELFAVFVFVSVICRHAAFRSEWMTLGTVVCILGAVHVLVMNNFMSRILLFTVDLRPWWLMQRQAVIIAWLLDSSLLWSDIFIAHIVIRVIKSVSATSPLLAYAADALNWAIFSVLGVSSNI